MLRTILHLSDIHFGSIDPLTVTPLIQVAHEVAPDVVVVSGDLTQRARPSQFIDARAFLDQLPSPQVIVPGNHDIPLYNIARRFLRPLDNYRRYISDRLEQYYADTEIAVLGINTARSLTFKNGRISLRQIRHVREKFCSLASHIVKIIVTHHPIDLPRQFAGQEVVGRAGRLMNVLAYCHADMLLAGHYHLSHTGDTASRYPIPGYTALVVHAGTATSSRGRGEPNAFNVIRIERPFVDIDRYAWQSETGLFQLIRQERFERHEGQWVN
ncbi:metallophosphoesterase family protein [Pelotalea chapellei]|uniref:Metallophosphoesterase n=1 Tax=Pelotalea chapellei TaxID=44671 RepID=A0ABS5U936_9BACT|nr:metallophosphoesterase family protein [Pelotalea chapellei]MBT1072174.1 metallophosphoesterase [Pelotalea chapellei]